MKVLGAELYWKCKHSENFSFIKVAFSLLPTTHGKLDTVGKTISTSVHFSSGTQSCLTLCDCMDCSTWALPVYHQLPEFTQTHVHWISDAIQQSHPRSSPFPPPIPPSIRIFSNESTLLIRWPKYWNFSFSISPSDEYSELVSFRIDWLDLLAVQGILKSLQHHSLKV